MAFLTELRMDCSDARQSMLIPATWIMPLNDNRPAPVRIASPRGMGPCLATSRNGWQPPCFLIAPETPCGQRSHHGMIFLFHGLTMTSTSCASRSPCTIFGCIAYSRRSRTTGENGVQRNSRPSACRCHVIVILVEINSFKSESNIFLSSIKLSSLVSVNRKPKTGYLL